MLISIFLTFVGKHFLNPYVYTKSICKNKQQTTSLNSILVTSNNSLQQPPLPANSVQGNATDRSTQDSSEQDQQQQQQQQQQNDQNDQSGETDQLNDNVLSNELTQLTVSDQNQLTATSMRSIGSNLDIDECIKRLLDVGMGGKIHKSVCFRNSEIIAICRAAQEVFLSQPVMKRGERERERKRKIILIIRQKTRSYFIVLLTTIITISQ